MLLAVKQVTVNEKAANARALQREIDLLCRLPANPHVTKYIGTEHSGDRLYIFLEFVSGGSVADMLKKFGGLDEAHILKSPLCGDACSTNSQKSSAQ